MSPCTRNANAQTKPPRSIVEEINSDEGIDSGASYMAELRFEKGKASIDDSDSKALSDLISRSIRAGEIKTIKVLGFSDQAYASEGGPADFFKRQKKLADSRNDAVKKFLEINYPQLSIEIYNMVTHPSSVEELVQNSDANVRKTIEDSGMMVGNAMNACAPKAVSKALVLSIVRKVK
jgi:hypothetical protein